MAVDLTPPGGNKVSSPNQQTTNLLQPAQLQQRLNSIQSSNQALANLKVNDVVKAVVDSVQSLTTSTNQANASAITATPANTLNISLNINGNTLNVVSDRPLTIGEVLVLKVLSQTQLEVLHQQVPTGTLKEAQVQQGLRDNLPIQQDFNSLLRKLITIAPKLPALLSQLAQLNPKLLQGINQYANTSTQTNAPNSTPSITNQKTNLIQQNSFITLAKSIKTLSQNIPRADGKFGAETVKDLIQNSGVFLEAKLAKANQATAGDKQQAGQNAIRSDLKAALVQVQQAIQKTSDNPEAQKQFEGLLRQITNLNPATNRTGASSYTSMSTTELSSATISQQFPQLLFPLQPTRSTHTSAQTAKDQFDLTLSTLLRQVAASIARIQIHQLSNAQAQQGREAEPSLLNSWQLEIPILHNQQVESFQVRIEERENEEEKEQSNNKKSKQWTITLAFDLAPLGPMCAVLTVIDDAVSATIWAEKQPTLKVLNEEITELRQSLENLGLEVGEVECRHGVPQSTTTQLKQNLVDVHT